MTMSTMMEQLLQQLTQVTPTSVWEWFLGDPLMVVSTILAAVILRWVLNRSIARIVDVTIAKHDARRERVPGRAGRVLAQATGLDHERHRQRTLTMGSILNSIVHLRRLLDRRAHGHGHRSASRSARCSPRLVSAVWRWASARRAWSRTSCRASS